MRIIKQNQKKLAARLREDANSLNRMYTDVATYPDLCPIAFQQEHAGPVIPPSERVPHSLIEDLRARADELRSLPRDHGILLKQYMPVTERRPIEELLFYVHFITGNVCEHFVALAEILSDVYERFGIDKPVSPDSLKKLFYRHVVPLIVKRYHQFVPPDKTPA